MEYCTLYDDSSPDEVFLQASSHALNLAIQSAELHSSAIYRPVEEVVLSKKSRNIKIACVISTL